MSLPAPPERVGRYVVLDRLAIGGMAEVFLAVERGPADLERLVVLKRILPHLSEDASFRAMFAQEARVAARLSHPNVVDILGLVEEGGSLSLVMEYVPGSNLRELQRAADEAGLPFPVDVAVELACQALDGAHAAHELKDAKGTPVGVVHRDLSPHNLMVRDDGLLQILDFGIAKVEDDAERTRTGMLKGKMRYMSPEQVKQGEIDRRSDLFTLGIVLWELLAGRRLFEEQTELAAVQALIAGQIPAIRDVRADVPEAIAQALHRALQTDRHRRYATAVDMRRSLQAAATSAGLVLDRERVRAFVARTVGEKHAARRAAVEARVRALSEARPPASPPVGTRGLGALVVVVAAVLAVAVVVALGAAGIGVAAWMRDPEPPTAGPAITVELAPVLDPSILVAELEPLRKYLERATGHPVTLKVGASYAATAEAVVSGEVDLASLPPLVYVRTRDAHPDVTPVAIQVFDGSRSTDGVLLVREDSPIRSAADLAGRSACYPDPSSTTGYALPRAWMRRNGLDPDADLGPPRISGNHFDALRDLLAGRCDVLGTYSGALFAADEAGIGVSRVRVLDVTGRTPHDALVARPGLDPALLARIRDALLAFDPQRDAGVARVGEAQRITGYVTADDEAFADLRAALAGEP